MNSVAVNKYIQQLGTQWSGYGVVVECGCWLGGSTAHLAAGLQSTAYNQSLHCFDRWQADAREVEKAKLFGITLTTGDNIQPLFSKFLSPFSIPIVTTRGPIQAAQWDNTPIEIFLLDAAKRPKVFFQTLKTFMPAWIPGKTIVGFMDMDHYRWVDATRTPEFEHQRAFLEACGDVFSLVNDFTDDEPTFVRYMGNLDLTTIFE